MGPYFAFFLHALNGSLKLDLVTFHILLTKISGPQAGRGRFLGVILIATYPPKNCWFKRASDPKPRTLNPTNPKPETWTLNPKP